MAASLLGVLTIAIALRIWAFPARYQVLGYDELPYVQGSLELVEGIVPAYKYAPAGPQTWLGWAYAGGSVIRYLVAPTPEERSAPPQVRPFVAVNHALFDQYRDPSSLRRCIVVAGLAVSILAVAAAFGFGVRVGGVAGGVLAGGLFAVAPLMMELGEQARPFAVAWSLVAISLFLAGGRWRRSCGLSAVCMGLAIGSRIDMLALLPVVWVEVYRTARIGVGGGPAPTRTRAAAAVAQHAAWTLVATLLIAPWLLTNLIGNLRTIATVGFSTPPGGSVPLREVVPNVLFTEALAPVLLLLVIGTVLGLSRRRLPRPAACLFVLLLLPTVFKDTRHGFAHHGAVVTGLFLLAPAALAGLAGGGRVRWVTVAVALGFPLLVTCRAEVARRRGYVPDQAVEWLSTHVPTGTILYLNPTLALLNPLPTVASADALWQAEMDNAAAERKFRSGMTRFNLPHMDVPRALSEENMTVERVYRRGWYILGSRPQLPDRRYDIRLYGGSTVFEPHDPVADFARTGGVVIWRGEPLDGLGDPVAGWVAPSGVGTFIYCSPDVRRRLNT